MSLRRTKIKKRKPVIRQQLQSEQLFDIPPGPPPEPEVSPIREPIWTENKSKLISRYLFYFVMITKHGTYIDGFAGPQEPDKPHMWAAKLVLESEPRWFRNFYLFDAGEEQVEALQKLKEAQPSDPKRTIEIIPGDFNATVLGLLSAQKIKMSEACFCLLDQRTFECRWETLVRLARYKTSGNKIELFYFLPNHWFSRALSGIKDTTRVEQWWGREDWKRLYDIDSSQRVELIVRRFKEELGYNSVKPWPIFERNDGGAIMYYMIHATDHPLAPSLMSRAYRKAVTPLEPIEQLKLDLAEFLT